MVEAAEHQIIDIFRQADIALAQWAKEDSSFILI